ncbi:hypothetical protein FHX16_006325 [Rhizobium sp. BK661]|nr:hypothetical protein [Rhizobium sp. BK661]
MWTSPAEKEFVTNSVRLFLMARNVTMYSFMGDVWTDAEHTTDGIVAESVSRAGRVYTTEFRVMRRQSGFQLKSVSNRSDEPVRRGRGSMCALFGDQGASSNASNDNFLRKR